jgi:hypothetical protein
MHRFGRLGLTLAILWAACVAISAISGCVDAFVHIGALRILELGTGIVGALPLLLAVTPGFTGPPFIWSAGLFSVAVSLLSQTVRSLLLGQPLFGSPVTAAGMAILLAVFCVWLGRALWRYARTP